ncbi:MAG: glycosyltransferase family 2 protein, partial [Solirubrobacteraceae bacterium]
MVIPTLGRQYKLERALERLAALTEEDFAVIVVSDALDPEPMVTAGRTVGPAGWRHIQASRPGASAARNAGWRATGAPVILFLDDDILADGELVAEHLAGHEAEPQERTCVLGDVRWARGLKLTPFMRWLDARGLQFDYLELTDGDDVGWGRMYTANVSLKRALLERVGGFDEAGFPYLYEDLDLARRAVDSGGLVVRYRRAASAEHLGATTLADWLARVELLAAAESAFVARYPDVTPHFHAFFSRAAAAPPARGRGQRLASLVPRATPVVGARVWASAEAAYAQALAPRLLAAWERGAAGAGSGVGGSEE